MSLEKTLKFETCKKVEIVNQDGVHLYSGSPSEICQTIYSVAKVLDYDYGKIKVQW